ncbi:MAG: hypothetical protein A2252_10925 [Elusimicrobia bacterium RIFOXYA2_FULL_39_19]|nr:MAG: hypothetical protein A2252_10925 [Elusimicrobia bacterium RIFOXYA2_FULL_39_19]
MKKIINILLFITSITTIFCSLGHATQTRLTNHNLYFIENSGGSGKIYFRKHQTAGYVDLFRMNEDGTGVTQLTFDELYESNAQFNSDKTKIALIKKSNDIDYIYTMNSDGTNKQSIYNTTNRIYSLRISPDGNKISFVVIESGNTNGTLYTMNFDGTGVRTLNYNSSSENPAKIASDIAVEPVDISVYKHNGSTMTKNIVDYQYGFSYSPDSSKLYFINYSSKQLLRIDADGTNLIYITTYSVSGTSIYALSNGKILFRRLNGSKYEIVTLNSDGTNYTVLFSTSRYISSFYISPDETKIIYLDTYYYASTTEYYFVIVNLSNGSFNMIELDNYTSLSWISNTKIAYLQNDDIGTYDLNSFTKQKATTDTSPYYELFDAKNNKILYGYQTNNTFKYYIMDETGANNHQVIDQSIYGNMGTIKLSPDGSKIAYSFKGNTTYYQLVVTNTDGTGVTVILAQGYNYDYYDFQYIGDVVR